MTIGVLGAGQLGRMLALAAHPLGQKLRLFDPSPDAPARDVAEVVTGAYEDRARLEPFARGLSVLTYEFESLPVESVEWLSSLVPVRPSARSLAVAQDRWLEKSLFVELGLPVPPLAKVDTRAELDAAIATVGLPCVLKTRRFGYDGKGQAVLRTAEDANEAFSRLGGRPLILEAFVPFRREVSIIGVRSLSGELRWYPLVENVHRDGILAVSRVPASPEVKPLEPQARALAERLMNALDHVGVLALELFQVDDRLMANEMAPRVHNSGHWTIEGAETSQFENHLRAILGWPLGSTELLGPAAMVNLIGATPAPEDLLHIPGAHLHLYGKQAAPGRKLGHVTLRAPTQELLDERLEALDQLVPLT